MTFRDLRAPFKAHLFSAAAGLCFADPDEGDGLAAGAGDGELSLRDELTAALAADSGSDGPSGVTPPAPEGAAVNPDNSAASALEGRTRDDQGRFAKPGQPNQTPESTPLAAAAPDSASGEQPAAQQASGPPPSWSAAAKAEWNRLPDAIRQEVGRHEATVQNAKAQWQEKGERLNKLTAAIGPRADRWRMGGIDEAGGIQRLVAAEDALERDPVNAIAHLARQFGVDLRAMVQATAQQQPQAQLPPQLQAMAQDVATLKGALAQQQQATEQTKVQGAFDQITAFSADPANKYFENVRERMAVLLQTRQASSLADAYEQAIWSDPQVRAAVQQEQAASQLDAQRAKASQARHASGSVIGSPAPGASPDRAGQNPNASVRDDLLAAYAAHA